MQGKKRYLALVLFLFLGLITFSFANPDDQLESVEGNVKKVSEPKDEKRVQSKFEEAKELVEKAEQNPTPEIIAEAEEILEEAQQEQPELVQEEDLVNRLNNTEPAIDAAALINAVEKMIDEATKKDDVSAAKTYFDNNNVATVTNNLEDGTVKENLNIRVAYLVKVFADETAPVITGIENNQTTNIDVALTISDDLDVNKKITLDGEEIEFKDTFNKDGVYVVVVTDDAQNTTSVTFTIDKVKPKFEGLPSREAHIESYKVDVTDATDVAITLQKDHGTFIDIEEGYEIVEEGTYQLVGVDKAGNKYTTWIIIDKTDPTITNSIEGEYINQCTTVTVFDRYMDKVTINDDVYKRADFTKNTRNENFKLEKEICEVGTYTITATDKIGKKTTKTFTIDKTAIGIKSANMYTNGKKYEIDKKTYYYATDGQKITAYVRLKEQSATLPVITLNIADKEYVLDNVKESFHNKDDEKNGVYKYQGTFTVSSDIELGNSEVSYTVTNISDKAGNQTTVTKVTNKNVVIVDKSVPTYKFYKEGSSLDKDEIQPTIIDGKLYFTENVRVRFVEEGSYFTQYIHNNFKNNENKTTIKTWTREAKTDGEHTMKVTDAAGNVTEVTFIIDTTAPTYKFYKEGSSLDKDEIKPTIVDGKLYFAENVRVRFTEESSFFTQYIHNDFVNNENKTTLKTWTREAKTEGEHTMKVTDAFGHVTEVTFVVDKTPNRVTQTFYRGSEVEGLKYYLTNGNKLQFNIGFRELLAEPAKVTIGGKEVELKYDKYYVATNSHMYYGYLEAAEDESDLVPGELEVEISNIVDYAGNKGFYYQTNGKKVYDTYKFTATTNGNVAIYKISKAEVETVEEFVEAVSKTSEITLLNDIELTEEVAIPENKELIIDLNGQSLTVDSDVTLISVEGKLTIKNGDLVNKNIEQKVMIDKTSGELVLEDLNIKDSGSKSGTTIYNREGKLTVNNVNIVIDSEKTGCKSGEACGNTAIESYGDLVVTNSTITSNSGSRYGITINGGNALIDNVILNTSRRGGMAIQAGNVTVNNVTTTAYWYAFYIINYYGNSNVTINGGSYTSSSYSTIYFGNASSIYNGNVTLNGGTFYTTAPASKKSHKVLLVDGAPAEGQDFALTIKGGEYKALVTEKVNPDSYLAEGFKVETINSTHKKVVQE